MEPPSYEEAHRQPVQGIQNSPAPPAYDASLLYPPTPPPTYREAVRPDPFPVLTPPSVPAAVSPPSRSSGVIVHPVTQIGERPRTHNRQTQPAVVVSQPEPTPVQVSFLRDAPTLVQCPHCNHQVTSKVRRVPGQAAWLLCFFLALIGLICGFCLIPLMVPGMQDVHHSCPRCGNRLHVYKK
ncbi:lipopolysaccharide-induced tumor necrosis factor-alpha factor homolog isoform 1-T2 [Pholidichthys leucotaenia]